MQQEADSVAMSVNWLSGKINNIVYDLGARDDNPLVFEDYSLDAADILLSNGKFEKTALDSLHVKDQKLTIHNFSITPKFSRKELSNLLKKERDHITLKIPTVTIASFKVGLAAERTLISAKELTVSQANLDIYRDKLVADDLTEKALYSKMLRNLKFDLDIDKVTIKQAYIAYSELVDATKPAGKIFFTKVNAKIQSLTNIKDKGKTKINVNANLMGEAPLVLNWDFDVQNTQDAFTVNGVITNLHATKLNPFLKPNLNATAEGTLQKMYFNFGGNYQVSNGDMRIKYDDFTFKILQKNSSNVNKFLTVIGNLFVKKDSDEKPQDFRSGEIKAERDPTKSFFNYLWINVKSGVISTLTGNGDKK